MESYRVTREDLAKSIHPTKTKVNSKSQPFKNKNVGTKMYDAVGKESPILKPEDTAAKSVITEVTAEYLVKINSLGQLYNPRDKQYLNDSLRLARMEGRPAYRFINCSPKQFQFYVDFLRTGNPAQLREAEKGIMK